MTDAVIIVENLSKSYLVGHMSAKEHRGHVTLRDVIARGAHDFARKTGDMLRGRQVVQGDEVEEFWALKDVSFEVKQGEVLGIIGRNGAGKSTLLKILSRITEPTKGRVTLRGRVASLLEVGTGFHPELSGRENIFLNGAILGMTQREIRQKFDEIVAFAEVEKFLDTPVKRYSSGMYVRLAFAVAAHLSPEIMIVDEVLAVGDVRFQEKCLGKMRDQAAEGRTVLFVSHNMGAVLQLTNRTILLSGGVVEFTGEPAAVVERYMYGQRRDRVVEFDARNKKRRYDGTGRAKIVSLRFDRPLAAFEFGEQFRFTIRVHAEASIPSIRASMTVHAGDGFSVGNTFSSEITGLESGEQRDLLVTSPPLRLAPGSYYCSVAIGTGNQHTGREEYDIVNDIMFFEALPSRAVSGTIADWVQGWGPICFQDLSVQWD